MCINWTACVQVQVPVYSLISMHMHVQPTHYLPWHEAITRTHSHIIIQLWICAPGTHRCWVARGNVGFRNLPKVSTHDHLGNRTPDLSLSSRPPYQLGHELLQYSNRILNPSTLLPGKAKLDLQINMHSNVSTVSIENPSSHSA